MPQISPHANVDPAAELADDVVVGAFARIGPQVRIGPGCIIEGNATLVGRTLLGPRNHVFPLAIVGPGEDGADSGGQVVLGEANAVREHAVLVGGRDRPTVIGNDNLIMIACRVGPGARIGNHGIFANCTHVGAGAIIEDYVRTSAFILIKPGVTVGAYTFTLGYAEIDRDAPPFAMVQGSPFFVRGVNTENLKRCGFGDDDIRRLKSAFRELFNGSDGQLNCQALDRFLSEESNPHIRRLAEAVRKGQARGGGP